MLNSCFLLSDVSFLTLSFEYVIINNSDSQDSRCFNFLLGRYTYVFAHSNFQIYTTKNLKKKFPKILLKLIYQIQVDDCGFEVGDFAAGRILDSDAENVVADVEVMAEIVKARILKLNEENLRRVVDSEEGHERLVHLAIRGADVLEFIAPVTNCYACVLQNF